MEDWRLVVDDPTEEKVFMALSDELWDYRTIDGISRATQLSNDRVLAIIQSYPRLVREARVPSPDGRALYRLRARGETPEEKRAEMLAFAANSY